MEYIEEGQRGTGGGKECFSKPGGFPGPEQRTASSLTMPARSPNRPFSEESLAMKSQEGK